MTDSFTCALCGETFTKVRSDEEAMDEALARFGDDLGPDPGVVCDDCFRALGLDETPDISTPGPGGGVIP